jgi:hypothetical protein
MGSIARGSPAQRRKAPIGLVVRGEEPLVRIVAVRELEQELVEVERREEARAAERPHRRRWLRGLQRS